MTKGTVEKAIVNKGGFGSILVNGEWYGTGKKGQPSCNEGDTVTFESYKKDGKWLQIKGSIQTVSGNERNISGPRPSFSKGTNGAGRESYWDTKAASDAAKEPRIAFQGAYERALEQFRIAKEAGAYPSLEKVKASEKLGLVRSLIEAEAHHIMQLAWHAKAPDAPKGAASSADDEQEEVVEQGDEGEWG